MSTDQQRGQPGRGWARHLLGCLLAPPLFAVALVLKPFRTAKRSPLRRCADQIAEEVKRRSYDHWAKREFPIVSRRLFEGRELQVEIDAWELTPEYVHIGISVDGGGLSACFPVGTSVIIKKE